MKIGLFILYIICSLIATIWSMDNTLVQLAFICILTLAAMDLFYYSITRWVNHIYK
jgi:hypothetical protein